MGRNRTNDVDLPTRVLKRHGSYFYVQPADGKWINLGREYPQAMMHWAKLIQRPGGMTTMGEIMDRYLLEIAPAKAKRTYLDNLKEMANLRAVFGALPPGDIEASAIYRYLDERGAPVRANREISLLSDVFKKAIRWGAANANPVTGIEKHVEVPRDRYVEDWELDLFKGLCNPTLRCYIDLKYLTGLRKGDLLTLTENSLTETGLYVVPRKTRKKHPRTGKEIQPKAMLFAWTEELGEAVSRIRALKKGHAMRSQYLFATRNGDCYYDIERSRADGFDAIWKRYMAKAKVRAKVIGKVLEHFTEHDIRAKNASDEIDSAVAQERLGHATVRATKIYRRKTQTVQPLRKGQ
jgi:integrase